MGFDELYGDVCGALDCKVDYEDKMRSICEYLRLMSPGDNKWYYNNTGFLQVDIVREEYDEYLGFVEGLVGCHHCFLMNRSGITLMFSLSSLKMCLELRL